MNEFMKKFKKVVTSPITTVVALVVAIGLLAFSSIGGARAALTYYSETYASRVEMFDIGVTLQENGVNITNRDYSSKADGTWNETKGVLLEHMIPEGDELKLGQAYPEVLTVLNSGTINTYIRVNLYKYWLDKDGNKMQELTPDWIDLNLVNLGSDWTLDEAASTTERTVLYYNRLLNAGQVTPSLSDTITIEPKVAAKVTETVSYEGGYKIIKTTYDYDGVTFCLEAEVDSVQEHNAEDAIWSAWGRRVSINNKTLSLK